MGWTHAGEVHGELSPVGVTPQCSRGTIPLPVAGESTGDEQTITPIPCLPVLLMGRRREGVFKDLILFLIILLWFFSNKFSAYL